MNTEISFIVIECKKWNIIAISFNHYFGYTIISISSSNYDGSMVMVAMFLKKIYLKSVFYKKKSTDDKKA